VVAVDPDDTPLLADIESAIRDITDPQLQDEGRLPGYLREPDHFIENDKLLTELGAASLGSDR